jgi:hypothetical protein
VGGAMGALFGIGQGGRIASIIKSSLYKNDEKNVRNGLASLLDKTAMVIEKKILIRDDGFKIIVLNLNQETNNTKAIDALAEYFNDKREYLINIKKRMIRLSQELRTNKGNLNEQIIDAFKLIGNSAVHPAMIQKELRDFHSVLNKLNIKLGR